jgi:chemotaxis protein CheD
VSSPDEIMDIFLQPGEMYFGDADTRIRTLLGSCVAIVFWHPVRRVGGMSHCLLPTADREQGASGPDPRYVDDAVRLLCDEAVRERTNPADYHIKLFGGADMFTKLGATNKTRIGTKNADMAIRTLTALGLGVVAQDIGGTVYRSVIFDVADGHVWVRCGSDETLAARGRAATV